MPLPQQQQQQQQQQQPQYSAPLQVTGADSLGNHSHKNLTQMASAAKPRPPPLRKMPVREFDAYSPPPIMTAPIYGSTKFEPPSPPSYTINYGNNSNNINNNNDSDTVHSHSQSMHANLSQHHSQSYNHNHNHNLNQNHNHIHNQSGSHRDDIDKSTSNNVKINDNSYINHNNSNSERYFSDQSQSQSQSHDHGHAQVQSQGHEYAQSLQQYSTAVAGSGIPALALTEPRTPSQYQGQYQSPEPASTPLLNGVIPRARRPKSMVAHDFETVSPRANYDHLPSQLSNDSSSSSPVGHQRYSQDAKSLNRKSLPAKSRQSTGAIIPQVPYSWVQSQNSEQQLEVSSLPRKHASRQSFHELEQQQIQQTLYQEKQQQEEDFRQQYYQQQFLQQQSQQPLSDAPDLTGYQSRTPVQGSASPHHHGQSTGSDMPMSPYPPLTPSSISNSDSSPMTGLTSPLSSGRSSTGYHSQHHKPASQIPPSPAMNEHYRSKSYSSGPIPLTLPLDSSPKSTESLSSVTSPYGSPSKPQGSRESITPSRKMTGAGAITQPRDHYRRSESYSNLQTRSSFANSSGITAMEPNMSSTVRNEIAMETSLQGDQGGQNRRDSWREQEQYLLQLQQRDHQARAKLKRESFYSAFQTAANSNQIASSGNTSNSSVSNEDPKQSTKTLSRAASPHLPSGIPQLRSKSRSGALSTPTADLKGRPTPPPRSRSRTPASSAGVNVSAPVAHQPQVPQQYSGELQSILRKSVVITDESLNLPATSPHRSPASSAPNSKSGTPLPQTADTIPVPIADISKHLGSLDIKDQAPNVAFAATIPGPEAVVPATTPRQHPSGNLGNSYRRSIVFDIPKTPVRANASNGTHEGQVGKLKDVGVVVSGTKERTSIFSSAPSTQSATRKRGKTLSAMDPPKAKPAPTILPPMYMSTTSRSTNIPAPMASRAAGSMIPSPSHGRGGSSGSKDTSARTVVRVNTEDLSANTFMGSAQNTRTIRSGGTIAENLVQRSNASATIANDPPKPKTTRSFSSGILSGLSRRRSTVLDPANSSTNNISSYHDSTPKVSSLSKASTAPHSTRLPLTSSQLLNQPDAKRTPNSELRTSAYIKDRNSPSAFPKQAPIVHGQAQALGHPMDSSAPPIYTTSAPHQTPEQEPKSPRASSGVSPFPPLSPYAALKLYAPHLSLYERAEIGEYPQVYYVGQNCRHKKPASLEASHSNFGFDDERGDYLIVNHDHLMFRYEVLDMLGKGSFGQVAKCYDHKTGEFVAIKIIRNKKRFHCQAVVEVKILNNLNKWDPEAKHNLIRMTDNFYFRNHLCIATELLSMNLYEFIKSNSFQGFSLGLIKRFCTQLLQSLELLNKHSVVHCDLKPENVLLKHPTKSSIKVIDFGSSCLENEKVYTYIQSRFYRSPEVILGMSYNMAIDMWSLGCILAELYTGYPLFPGENEQEQLSCIMEIQGVPDRYLVDRSSRKKVFFDSVGNPKLVVNSKGKRRRPGSKTLAQALKCNDPLFLDFIGRCLIWDPEKRMKPREGLQHEWISDIRAPSRPPFSPVPADTSFSSTSRRKSSIFSSQPAFMSRPLKVKTESDDSKTNRASSSTKVGRTSTSNGNQSFSGNVSHDSHSGNSYSYGYGSSSGDGDTSFSSRNGHSHSHSHGHGNGSNKYGQQYSGLYSTPSSSTVSSASLRRLTVAGDQGGSSYFSGSRKNATSMYVTGSSNTIGVASSADYLRQASRDSSARVGRD
ncbi:hypothetical protein BG004_006737 [Podila humilis]|nr:hypothetical protein BG004_006737 [Podila humilis]